MLPLSLRDTLQANGGHFSVLVTWSTIVVAAGVAIEGVELIHDATAWIKRRHIRKKELADLKEVAEIFPASRGVIGSESNIDHPRWVKRITRIGLILVVIGVLGEWRYGAKLEDAHNDLQKFDESLIADTEKEAAQLRKEAAGLQKQAEDERSARVKIEAQVAWRRLTEEQKKEIGLNLSRFSNQGVSFWYSAADIEASGFVDDIAEAVSRAKTLRVYAPASFIDAQEGGHGNLGKPIKRQDTGVIVSSTADTPSCSLADAIVKELRVRGFDAKTRKDLRTDVRPQVWVTVEWRPEGPQGDFKLQAERDAKAKKMATTSK